MSELLLEVSQLRVCYGKVEAVHDVNLKLERGSIACVIGPNGAGKSTLLNAIMGILPSQGTIRFQGQSLQHMSLEDRVMAGIGLVPETRELFGSMSVEDNLLLGSFRRLRRGEAHPQDQLPMVFELFPRLKERQHTEAGVLSGGEQQMLTLCRTLMGDPDLIIIDEPTEGLAPKIVELVGQYLQTLKQKGISVLLIEQKLTIAMNISDRTLVMGHGSIVFEGTPDGLRADNYIRKEWLEV